MNLPFDALLVVSFGGPERPEDVLPFLENVVRGRNIPRARLLEVADHYQHFGGVSPINAQNRALISAIEVDFQRHQIPLPVFFGNRNWHPFLADAVAKMRDQGIRRVLAFVTSPFGSYSSCRQYLENIEAARNEVGPDAPIIEKLRAYFNHPGYVQPVAALARQSLDRVDPARRHDCRILFTAHSIPISMSSTSPYVAQLVEASRLVAESLAHNSWELVYQSRSGAPNQPWLEPDIGQRLREMANQGVRDVVVVPIGFISDHVEVLYDLDVEAITIARQFGINMGRSPTVGCHPGFVEMVRLLVQERLDSSLPRQKLGTLDACPDACPSDCCAYRRGS